MREWEISTHSRTADQGAGLIHPAALVPKRVCTLSAVIERQDSNGVLLRYHPDKLGQHHVEQRPRMSDRARIALIEAAREFRVLALIAESLDVSEHGRSRIYLGLSRIQNAHNVWRRECGMAPKEIEIEVVAA